MCSANDPQISSYNSLRAIKGFLKKNAWNDRGQNPDVNCILVWALFFKIHIQWIFTFFKGHVKIFLDSTYFSVTYFLVIIKTIILIQHAKFDDNWQQPTFMQFMKSVNPINASDSPYSHIKSCLTWRMKSMKIPMLDSYGYNWYKKGLCIGYIRSDCICKMILNNVWK